MNTTFNFQTTESTPTLFATTSLWNLRGLNSPATRGYKTLSCVGQPQIVDTNINFSKATEQQGAMLK